MPRIFDNIDTELLPALKQSLSKAFRADFCVGYMNLRGWRHIAQEFENWAGGDEGCCRVLVGMPVDQDRELRRQYALVPEDQLVDKATIIRVKRQMAEKFKNQLALGLPTDADQTGLRKLAQQLRDRKLRVKLHARYPLHAKLYLAIRDDHDNPATAYLGSSNLTHSGLRNQGELNIDVLDHDAIGKLCQWFEDRWNDKYSLDISDQLVEIIEDSWITERTPYEVYIKMAYHLSREARSGIEGFAIPRIFGEKLFAYQTEAVKIAAHHLEKRGGVLLGDVVGLGKTLMATAVARLYVEKNNLIPLIVCPPNLVPMWEAYSREYDLYARVLSMGQVSRLRGEFSRHKLVIIDESHNLRNRETARYRDIKQYIEDMSASVILLSATPYNKGNEDISSQLRLFIDEDQNLGIRPDALIRTLPNGAGEFYSRFQCLPHTIRAFEHSPHKEDWQQLMQKYMVRRTRTFIKSHYADTDPQSGRKFLLTSEGHRRPFPDRIPHTVTFDFDPKSPANPYARLYSQAVVNIIDHLSLPRYGLGNEVDPESTVHQNNEEQAVIRDLSRAGKRLMGFCRTNLFKRLESCGESFLLSVERHVLRNYIFAYAIENGLPIPIGTQDPALLDSSTTDFDADLISSEDDSKGSAEGVQEEMETLFDELLHQRQLPLGAKQPSPMDKCESEFRERARKSYELLATSFRSRFQWVRPLIFKKELHSKLIEDGRQLIRILIDNPRWDPDQDCKLERLYRLCAEEHPTEKILIFTQFADTAHYLHRELVKRGLTACEQVTGETSDVASVAARFSPSTNPKAEGPSIRVLIATDVLSEGQNLQDGHVIVNFDLPWAIIRLVQRAGRVDRIGQQHETIDCYTFMPMGGIEDVINLRKKVRARLRENAEVVGTDEAFFDDDGHDQPLIDLYNEKSGILDGTEDEHEVDLQSRAFQIYKDAIDTDPKLEQLIKEMPDVVYSGKDREAKPSGVLVYVRSPDDTDSLAYVGKDGAIVSQNQADILDAAKCDPQTPAVDNLENHHQLVRTGVEVLVREDRSSGGQLGKKTGARYRGYMALRRYLTANEGSILVPQEMSRALELMLKTPLQRRATESINALLSKKGTDEDVANLIADLYNEQRLCFAEDEEGTFEPRIICSLSLV